MRRRSPARWLAPLALVTCAVAIYAVVDNELRSDEGGAKTSSSTKTSTTATTATTATTKRKSTKKTARYVVKAGDSFSVIASKEGVDAAALQAANPDVDPSALHPGQKLKLPR
jgi:LysM repeat protein